MAYEKEKHKKEERRYTYASKKEIKPVLEEINKRFGFNYPFLENHVFIMHGDKVWITNEELPKLDYSRLRLEGIGFVFARITKKGIKITTNTAQMFGKYATKNIITLTQEEVDKVIRGLDIEIEDERVREIEEGYVIMRSHLGDYLGVGLYRNGRIKNMIPKARRIRKL